MDKFSLIMAPRFFKEQTEFISASLISIELIFSLLKLCFDPIIMNSVFPSLMGYAWNRMFLLFTDLRVKVLSTPTFIRFLKEQTEVVLSILILKVVP